MEKEAKQVIIIRKDLKMRRGKEISQGSHASLAVVLNEMRKDKNTFEFKIEKDSPWDKWLNGLFTKICVYCNSEQELIDIYDKAKVANIPAVLITDAGLTEFNGVPTKTCVAIGPYWSEEIDKITRHLPLL